MIKTIWNLAVTMLGLVGVGLIAFGAWLIFPPLGIIIVGAFLVFVAVITES